MSGFRYTGPRNTATLKPNIVYERFTLDLEHDKHNEPYPLAELRLWGPLQFQSGFNEESLRIEFVFDGAFTLDQDWLRVEFVEKLRCALKETLAFGVREEFKER